MAHVIDGNLCVACGSCEPVCPTESITPGDVYVIDPETCIDCGACAEACPTECISAE